MIKHFNRISGHGFITNKVMQKFCAIALATVVSLTGCGDSDSNDEQQQAGNSQETAHATLSATPPPANNPLALTIKPNMPPAPKPTEPLTDDASCITSQCHASFATANFVHGPVSEQGCNTCHAPDTGTHQYPLLRQENEVCSFCHTVTGKHENIHPAVTESGCLSCHDPHASQQKYLLTEHSIEAVCLRCHELPQGKFPHGPFADGDCTSCHQPHETDTDNLLRGGEGSKHCFMCHKTTQYTIANAPYVHEPAVEDCTVCHDPHLSDQPNHLNSPVERLCFDCHDQIAEKVQFASTQHQGVFTADKCANCHNPHASGRENLFKNRLDVMCLKCHDQEIKTSTGRIIPDMKEQITERKFLHGPIKSGDCAACHSAHGTSHVNLLVKTFPKGFYEKFDLQNYALCFSCHDKQLVLEPKATETTNFRDGDANLHYLHVNKSRKGRTCKSCHAVHGSDLPTHMAKEVPFEGSSWLMPVGFEKTTSGGSCAPGCHEFSSYDRQSPVNKNLLPSSGGDQ